MKPPPLITFTIDLSFVSFLIIDLFQQLQEDMIRHFSEIVDWLKQREYVRVCVSVSQLNKQTTMIFTTFNLKANDCYLRMAIGNAPWPIGVTMVGIHERSAREKIFSNQVINNPPISHLHLHLFN